MKASSEPQRQRALVVGTAPPTRCGLASYTFNLSRAIEYDGMTADILRLVDDNDVITGQPFAIRCLWNRSSASSLRTAATFANSYDALLLQHEFGIYPGPDGCDVSEFLGLLSIPVVSVLHTVLSHPSGLQRETINTIARISSSVVVHTSTAQDRLLETYDIDPGKVNVIPHGASSRIGLSQELDRGVPTLLTWGLIGPGKGIEHGIEAIAELRHRGLDVEYVVAGATHPNVLRTSGDGYRHDLMALSRTLDVSDLIRFDDHYRSRDEQEQLLRSSSFVLLPYDSRDQVTSGVLVEALAAGKPIVSTGFPHARELSDCGGLALVDHQQPMQIADAVEAILTAPSLYDLMRRSSWLEGLRHDWSVVGPRFSRLLDASSAGVLGEVVPLRSAVPTQAVVA